MPFRANQVWPARVIILPVFFIIITLIKPEAFAEIRTIIATGEYRMGDNDTRTDAKRLALLDAKRLALEQAGTYVESITEVKNFILTREEISAYTAGIVEVIEQETQDTIEGATQVVRVKVSAQIDTDVVTRQIDMLRMNIMAKEELLRIRAEKDQLQQLLDMQTRELSALQSKAQLDEATRERQRLLGKTEADALVTKALTALSAAGGTLITGASTAQGRDRARALGNEALRLDPTNSNAHLILGFAFVEEKQYSKAVDEYRMALKILMARKAPPEKLAGPRFMIGYALWNQQPRGVPSDEAIQEMRIGTRLDPKNAEYRKVLISALKAKGDWNGALSEYRMAARLKPEDPPFDPYLITLDLVDAGKWDEAFAKWSHYEGPYEGPRPLDYLYLGRFLQRTGRALAAAWAYQKVLKFAQETPGYDGLIKEIKKELAELEK